MTVWAIMLIVTLHGQTRVIPGNDLLHTEVDCHRFGEIWESEYAKQSGVPLSALDHMCFPTRAPGIDI